MVVVVAAAEMRSKVEKVETRLDGHEELCANRYEVIIARLDRLEHMIIGAAGTLLVALLGAVLLHIKW